MTRTRAAALVIFGTRCRCEQGVRLGRRCATAAVRTSDDFQQVAVRVIKVYAASTVPGVDLVALAAPWVGPKGQAPFANPLKDLVEFALVHQERVVLRSDLTFSGDKVERCF